MSRADRVNVRTTRPGPIVPQSVPIGGGIVTVSFRPWVLAASAFPSM
jgi:hypothetical protein